MASVTKENANEILRKYLHEHGITQTYVAYKVGLTPQAFSYYITGRNKMNADFAFKVAKVLNISPNIFLSKSYTERLGKKGTI